MTGGQSRPLLVAGVAGGVGTSTWVRILLSRFPFPVEDRRVYQGGEVDVLVTSNTAAATSQLKHALAACPRPPLLVVMHTHSGVVDASRAHLLNVGPHITARFDISHQRSWLELATPPNERASARVKNDIKEALRAFPAALQRMYPALAPSPPPPVPLHTPASRAPMPVAVAASRPPASPRAGPPQHQRWAPSLIPQHQGVYHRGGQGG